MQENLFLPIIYKKTHILFLNFENNILKIIFLNNIHFKHSKLKNGQSANDIACQKAILDIYKSAANIALEKDKKKFDELLRKGKITKEQYDAFRLTLVTVGTGLSDLRNFNRVQFGAS